MAVYNVCDKLTHPESAQMARVNEGSHLPSIRLSTNGMSHPAFSPQPQSITAL